MGEVNSSLVRRGGLLCFHKEGNASWYWGAGEGIRELNATIGRLQFNSLLVVFAIINLITIIKINELDERKIKSILICIGYLV